MPAPTKKVTWSDLNERQQQYMLIIYEHDQIQESNAKSLMRFYQRSIPADQWRWIEYSGMYDDNSYLKRDLKKAKLVDSGTGSTFEALRERGLILVKYDASVLIRLTTPGRALVRKVLKEQTQEKEG